MTAQIGDSFWFKNHEYSIVAMSEPLCFRPQDYGIIPIGVSTDCRAGFWCEYEISDVGIILENFYVHAKEDYYPAVNGVTPFEEDDGQFQYMGYHLYKGVHIKMPYTGKIVAGKDFLRDYYIHMGYQRAWAYRELKEFVFEEGALTDVIDHSRKAEELREQIVKDPDYWIKLHKDPTFIESCFDLSMEKKAWWIQSGE